MKQDNMPQVARFWNDIAGEFDSIYSGANKNAFGRFLDRFFRKDIYERFDWVMRKCGDVRGKTICDIGCGSGRFVTEFAKRGAEHVTGVDVAPDMLKLASRLVEHDGVSGKCDFVLADVLNWNTDRKFDITIAIGFWDYIMDPPERLRLIRNLTTGTFLSAWPRFWTWRMPVRKVRLQYIRGCPVYFFRKPAVYEMLESAGFEVVSCESVGKLFCVEARPR
ncbi:MAG: methyltransferase domain-containing protein [Deltaproteobacteria bacterium]|nr:methyltransferase domain-containing protein [Deltaproteobacteria bacterium]